MVSGLPVKVLDGDETRRRLSPDLGYSREDRLTHLSRIVYLAESLTSVGAIPIVAAISPYRLSREQARQRIERFVEVYLCCPLEVCIQRDVKGHYQKAIKGEIENFTGISDPYEPPLSPEVILESHLESPRQGVDHFSARWPTFAIYRRTVHKSEPHRNRSSIRSLDYSRNRGWNSW